MTTSTLTPVVGTLRLGTRDSSGAWIPSPTWLPSSDDADLTTAVTRLMDEHGSRAALPVTVESLSIRFVTWPVDGVARMCDGTVRRPVRGPQRCSAATRRWQTVTRDDLTIGRHTCRPEVVITVRIEGLDHVGCWTVTSSAWAVLEDARSWQRVLDSPAPLRALLEVVHHTDDDGQPLRSMPTLRWITDEADAASIEF